MKKKFIITHLLVILGFLSVQAQYVNIPDSNFRSFLIANYGSCFNSAGQMDTTCIQNQQIYAINCSNKNIKSLEGLQYITRNKFWFSLTCNNNPIDSFPTDIKFSYLESKHTLLTVFPKINSSFVSSIDLTGNLLTIIPSFSTIDSGFNMILDSNNINTIMAFPTMRSPFGYGTISLKGNPTLTCLPYIPNWVYQLNISGTGLTCIPNKPKQAGAQFQLIPSSIPVCNPATNVNDCKGVPIVNGRIYIDLNKNGIKDGFEKYVPYATVISSDKQYAWTDSNGSFEFGFADTGTYSLKYSFNNSLFKSMPDSNVVKLGQYNANITLPDVALQPITFKDSLAVYSYSFWSARPGRPTSDWITIANAGSTLLTPTITYLYDTSHLVYDSASFTGNVTQQGNTITITNSLMYPGDIHYGRLFFTVKTSANIGDTIHNVFYAQAGSYSSYKWINVPVRNSFDPNDKRATIALSPSQIANGEYIDYTVRFQNVGNAPAIDVVIADTLSSNLLQNRVVITGMSHNGGIKLQGNTLFFEFKNINLIDSATSPLLSQGFISFRVKPLASLKAGNKVDNKAAIYFDFNKPIITNIATTLIKNFALPLQLISYNVSVQNKNSKTITVENKWITANEINTSHFIVLRSTNGIDFKAVAEIAAKGGGNYNFNDEGIDAKLNTVYYRLKMIDKNGESALSEIKKITLSSNETEFSFFPNPVKNHVQIVTSKGNVASINITNLLGKVVFNQSIKNTSTTQQISLGNLDKGMYTIMITYRDGTTSTQKMIVQ